MKICVVCGGPLTGKQQRYCKPLCASKGFNEARKADGRLKAYREGKGRDKKAAWQRENAHRYKGRYEGRYKEAVECRNCGGTFQRDTGGTGSRQQTCTRTCGQQMKLGYCRLPKDHPARVLRRAKYSALSALAVALEVQDSDEIVRLLLLKSEPGPDGCLLWSGRQKGGYPQVRIRGRQLGAHRLVTAAVYGDLGAMAAHHKCARSLCINPDHLQPVTHSENTAEMLHRTYYLARIAELEKALLELSPHHALLTTPHAA